MPAASDRALQDALIRLLADASFRSALCTAESGDARAPLAPEHAAMLRALSPDRVRRFARFVARGYYHERVAHFYKYSHALAHWTERRPADALRSRDFDALLDRVTLGSRESARDVASVVDTYLADAPHAPPYAADLRRYEAAQMIIEAGPRVWRSTAPAPSVAPDTVVAPDPDTLVLDFAWDLPAVLPALRSLHATEPAAPSPPPAAPSPPPAAPSPPPAPHNATQLLFARSPRARVTIMRWSEQLARLVAAMDGTRELRDVAAAAGLPAHDVVEIASALAEAGAIHIA